MSSRVIGLTTARHGSLWIIAHLPGIVSALFERRNDRLALTNIRLSRIPEMPPAAPMPRNPLILKPGEMLSKF